MNGVSGTVIEVKSSNPTLTTGPWTGGAGRVDGFMDIAPLTSHQTEVVTTGALAASGDFTLSMPTTVPTTALMPFNPETVVLTGLFVSLTNGEATCTGTPTFSTKSAQQSSLRLGAIGTVSGEMRPQLLTETQTTQTTAQGEVIKTSSVLQEGALVYFDAPVTLNGTVTCSGPVALAPSGTVTGKVVFNAKFVKGWNKANITLDQNAVVTTTSSTVNADITLNITLTAGSLPTDKWTVVSPIPTSQGVKAPRSFFMR